MEFFQRLKFGSPVEEKDVKIALKELSCCTTEDHLAVTSVLVNGLQEFAKTPLVSEEELSNALRVLKLISEDLIINRIIDKTILSAFADAFFPVLTAVIKRNADGSSSHAQKSISWLHKCVKTSLFFVKVVSHKAKSEVDSANERSSLYEFATSLIQLLNDHPVATLDIKCNAGLILCHIGKDNLVEVIQGETAFDKSCEKFNNEVIEFMKLDYVNRIAVCFGVLGARDQFSSELLDTVVKQVLERVDNNSTREAVNLGSARVLEIWADKVRVKAQASEDLSSLLPALQSVKIYVFTNIAGHIDAVKTCCRNILTSLSVVFTHADPTGELLKDAMTELLAKPYHIKWIGLSALVRGNPKSTTLLKVLQNTPMALLCAERTIKTAASEVYLSMMTFTFGQMSSEEWVRTWMAPLFEDHPLQDAETTWSQKKQILTKSLGSHGAEIRKLIITTVVGVLRDDEAVLKLLPKDVKSAPESYLLVVEACKIGAELEISIPNLPLGDKENQEELFRGLLPRSAFMAWTYHSNPQIRLAAFALLVDTRKTSEVFHYADHEVLKSMLEYNIVSQNPAFRQQFYGYFKKLVRRLKDSKNLCKKKNRAEDEQRIDELLMWTWRFLIRDCLFPGASFSRRCQALSCLSVMILHFLIQQYFETVPEEEKLSHLQWLEDTYENNKVAAVEVLKHMKLESLKDTKFLNAMIARSMDLLTSVRPPESATGRYLFLFLLKSTSSYPWNFLRMLLTKLIMIVDSIKKTSLLEVSSTSPPYGILRAIRLILSEYKDQLIFEMTKGKKGDKPMKSGSHPLSFDIMQDFVHKLLQTCFDLNQHVFPVLGSAAPEGFLPDLNENPDPKIEPENSKIVRSINAQMLLVSSWRSMKEVCILMTDLVVMFPVEGEVPVPEGSKAEKECVLQFSEVKTIGDHLVYLLSNLMHRGVFEQVFVGFRALNQRLKIAKTKELNLLSQQWLVNIMDSVGDKCVTRRSAGLPLIFQAVLTPEVANEELINQWMHKLLDIKASQDSSTMRIHKMNILRTLFRDATFARAIMQWVPEGIKRSIRALHCDDWAEQNSGLILYGSVIRRTFGPNLNLMSASTFFRKFREMYDFLLDQIQCLAGSIAADGLKSQRQGDFAYHLLLLFSCFASAPGKMEEGDFKLSAFVPYILDCGCSGDIQVRTIASKSLTSFIASPGDREALLLKCLDRLMSFSNLGNSNAIHGTALQLLAILKYIKTCEETVSNEAKERLQISIDCVKGSSAPPVLEAFADVSVAIWNLKDPKLASTALTMGLATRKTLEAISSSENQKTLIGLPNAREAVYNAQVEMELSRDTALSWIQSNNRYLVLELIRVLTTSTHESGDIQVQQALVQHYLSLDLPYVGETDEELAYLTYFASSNCDLAQAFECDQSRLLNRLLSICSSSYGTMESKGSALQCLGKLIFRQPDQELICKYIEIVFDWMDSQLEDELRYGVASSLPILDQMLSALPSIEFCKLWSVVITLARDDEGSIRHEVYKRLPLKSQSDIPGCDRKCLELVLQTFLKQIQQRSLSEGLLTLIGLLVRDDYEVIATVADDDDEDRLFDRSEMNMYAENVTTLNMIEAHLKKSPEDHEALKKLISSSTTPMPENVQKFISLLTHSQASFKSSISFRDYLDSLLASSNHSSSGSDQLVNVVEEDTKCEVDDMWGLPEKEVTNEHPVVSKLFLNSTKSLVIPGIKSRLRDLFL